MKLLTFSTLYPNSVQPNHGIFVETRLRHLLTSGQVNSRVVAPVPWFPFPQASFGRYSEYARVPSREERFGIDVRHPHYLTIPKVGMNWAPKSLAHASITCGEQLRDEGYDFDAIDAHYFYPDGVAAAMLGDRLNRPVVITARGSDVNLIAEFPRPRAMIRWAAQRAAAVIAVSRALKDKLVEVGIDGGKIQVLRNGVDLECFRPGDRSTTRARLGLDNGPALLSVGNLVPEKGHDLTIRALASLSDARLLLVGDGPQMASLRGLARSLGLANRVHFLGLLSQSELVQVYGAADLLVLASSREGWANVLLESMACGTPVVATDVGAAKEVIRSPEAGAIVPVRTPQALAAAIRQLLEHLPDRAATRSYAAKFGWEETTHGQIEVFTRVIRDRQNNAADYVRVLSS
jgi:teichuronic acid biosynthesis glycosyltransferase TuaC